MNPNNARFEVEIKHSAFAGNELLNFHGEVFYVQSPQLESFVTVTGKMQDWINHTVQEVVSNEKFVSYGPDDDWAFYFGFAKRKYRPISAGDKICLGEFTDGKFTGEMTCVRSPQLSGSLSASLLMASAEFVIRNS